MKQATLKIGGRNYTLSAMDAQGVMEIHEEFQRTAQCPVAELMEVANQLPETMRDEYIKAHLNDAIARKRSRKSIESTEFKRWMEDAESLTRAARIYHAMFKKHHPDLTREECLELALQAIEEGGEDVFVALFPNKLAHPKARGGRGTRVPSK